jgi:hypothetical protein
MTSRSPSEISIPANRQSSIEEERSRRLSRIGAAQIFPGFNQKGSKIFSNIINHQNIAHFSIPKASSITSLHLTQKTRENKGFPSRHSPSQQEETQRKFGMRMEMQTRPKELKYDLAERMRSRKMKTLNYDSDGSEEDKNAELKNSVLNSWSDGSATMKRSLRLRRKKVILEGSDDEREDDDRDRDRRDMTNATRNNTIASTTNYLTAATGNRNTVIRTKNSRISSRGSEED